MKLSLLLKTLLPYQKLHSGDPDIKSIHMDHREITASSLFVCVPGAKFDGHRFAEEAARKGAAAIIAEKPVSVDVPVIIVPDSRRAMSILTDRLYQQPSHKLSLIGVTGTNGKTTITHLISQIQKHAEIKTGIIGTIGIKYGEVEQPASMTTPEIPVLQKAFSEMAGAGVHSVVMEVSSHALVKGRVRGLDFDIAVFTNLTQDHLEYHKTMKDYLHAKSLLFSQLGNTYGTERVKVGVINNDDAAAPVLKEATAGQILTYGIDWPADVKAENIRITAKGTQFDLITPYETRQVNTKLIGKFNVYNVLAAACASYLNGVSWEIIFEALEKLEGVGGRFEPVEAGQSFTVIVDYSHTPDSLENVLTTIKEFARGRVISVAGCGGDRDTTKRPLMAQVAVEKSDLAIFTSDNPRTEDPLKIIADMEAGVPRASYVKIPDRKEAIEYAISEARAEDVILIAGKGHETYQIIGTETFAFDDRVVARDAIKERLNDGN